MSRRSSGLGVPLALVALSIIPLVSGSLRLVELGGGPQVLPENVRISDSPAPLVVHVVGAFAFALLGALQLARRFRQRHLTWHRRVGRVLVVAGLGVALSGMWMTVFYSGAPGGPLLWTVRLVVSGVMGTALVLGFAAIRRRDVPAHRAWMIRAYALGLGAGTQVFTQGFGEALFGRSDLSTGASISVAWLFNAAVAEWAIRRSARPRRRTEQRVSARLAPAE